MKVLACVDNCGKVYRLKTSWHYTEVIPAQVGIGTFKLICIDDFNRWSDTETSNGFYFGMDLILIANSLEEYYKTFYDKEKTVPNRRTRKTKKTKQTSRK